MDNIVFATIKRGNTEWLARVLEPGKEPVYFMPSGMYAGVPMLLKSVLCKAVNDTYGADRVVFVSGHLFNRKVEERASASISDERG